MIASGDPSPPPGAYRAGNAPQRVPANGSQPRLDLGSADDPDVLNAHQAANDDQVSAGWTAYLPDREMGVRIFVAGLVALVIAISGLVTMAVRRRP